MRPPSSNQPGNGGQRRSAYAAKIGQRAEALVYKTLEREGRPGLRWIADEGDKPGWDIQYLDDWGEIVAVEVKATTGARFASIEMTVNEWRACHTMRDRYRLFLVSSCLSDAPLCEVIDDPASLQERGQLHVSPLSYRIEMLG